MIFSSGAIVACKESRKYRMENGVIQQAPLAETYFLFPPFPKQHPVLLLPFDLYPFNFFINNHLLHSLYIPAGKDHDGRDKPSLMH
jgi:hypothetical protein